jgi:hypothetical protein
VALDRVLLVVRGFEHPTSLGTTYVFARAVVVAVLAEREFSGLRKTAAAHAIPVRSLRLRRSGNDLRKFDLK